MFSLHFVIIIWKFENLCQFVTLCNKHFLNDPRKRAYFKADSVCPEICFINPGRTVDLSKKRTLYQNLRYWFKLQTSSFLLLNYTFTNLRVWFQIGSWFFKIATKNTQLRQFWFRP